MRSDGVVVVFPGRQSGSRVGERGEQRLVQEFVAQTSIEALYEGVLRWLAWGDVVPFDAGLLRPAQDRHTGKLGPVVGNAGQRTTTRSDHEVELPSDAEPGERGVGDQAQALAGEVVDHRQDTEASTVGERVADEVERPALVRPLRQGDRCPGAKRALASAATQAYLTVIERNPQAVETALAEG